MQAIARARVPIVKFEDALTRLQVDLSFRNGMPVYNTQLICQYTRTHTLVRPYLMVIRYWAKIQVRNHGLFLRGQTYSLHTALTPRRSLALASQKRCWRTHSTYKSLDLQKAKLAIPSSSLDVLEIHLSFFSWLLSSSLLSSYDCSHFSCFHYSLFFSLSLSLLFF